MVVESELGAGTTVTFKLNRSIAEGEEGLVETDDPEKPTRPFA